VSQIATTGVRDALDEIARQLADAGLDAPQTEAEALLASVLGAGSRHELYLEERDLSGGEMERLERVLVRRLSGEPLQYITGEAAFRGLTLSVDCRALIPRPETEGLVGVALQLMGAQEKPTVLDAGTGSGAIALALAVERSSWKILAADVSGAALELAQENAERYDAYQVEWMEADITSLGFWRLLPPLDLVISNPPYVAEAEWNELPVEICNHEPPRALLAGPDGLDVIRPLLEGASMRVKPGGLVVVEIGQTQSDKVMQLASLHGFVDVRVAPDLSGHPRYLIAEQRRSSE
jgi:release factor glutamine methyltransferase